MGLTVTVTLQVLPALSMRNLPLLTLQILDMPEAALTLTVALAGTVSPSKRATFLAVHAEFFLADGKAGVTVGAVTVTDAVAVFNLSVVVAVIVADPIPTGVTTPEEFTVATKELEDDHVVVLIAAFEGVTVAVRVCDEPPKVNCNDDGETATPVTTMLGVSVPLVRKLPSTGGLNPGFDSATPATRTT